MIEFTKMCLYNFTFLFLALKSEMFNSLSDLAAKSDNVGHLVTKQKIEDE